jgi:DNA-binding NarL/FixJ family response regulator
MIRVLIVDDYQITRRGLKDIFADAFPQVQVGEAKNSQTALEQLMKQEWDLVLVDVKSRWIRCFAGHALSSCKPGVAGPRRRRFKRSGEI